MNLNVLKSRRAQRGCGECRACCTTCAVVELNKPLNTPCQHLCDRGCGIYESRPNSCREYDCAWLQGHLSDKHRPDRSGIVFTFERIGAVEGMLVHAMLTSDDVPLDRVEYLYNVLRQTMKERTSLQIIPASLRVRAQKNVFGKPLKPGVYVAVGEAQESS